MGKQTKDVKRYIKDTPIRAIPYRKMPYHRVVFRVKSAKGRAAVGGPEITLPAPFAATDEDQAAVVGGGLTTFAAGVSAEVRRALTNCLLFAYLAANAKAKDTELDAWYRQYFSVLMNVAMWIPAGTLRLDTFATSQADLNVHDAILKVAAGLLGGAADAFQLVSDALTALEASSGTAPWFTLFQQQSQFAQVGRCQVSVTTQDTGGPVKLSLMGFGLMARSTLTQVLFFRFKSQHATLKRCAQKASIDDMGLLEVNPLLEKRLSAAGAGAGFIEEVPLRV